LHFEWNLQFKQRMQAHGKKLRAFATLRLAIWLFIATALSESATQSYRLEFLPLVDPGTLSKGGSVVPNYGFEH
jgi:hypothetical protein